MIGMSSTEFSNTDFLEVWHSVSRGFHHWEIVSEGRHSIQANKAVFEENRDLFDMTYSLHAAMSDTNLGALNDTMHEASLREFEIEIACAADLGFDTVTIHPGVVNLACKSLRAASVERSRRSMKAVESLQEEYGIPLAIENMPNIPVMIGVTAGELASLVEGTDLGVCIDIGHAHTSSQFDELMDAFSDRVVNVHIHDNDGRADQHLTIGDGNIDFRRVLKRFAGYGGNFVIEARSLESAEESQRRLSALPFFLGQ